MDLTNDPGEMNNLASLPEFQPVLNEHRHYLAQWIEQTGDTPAREFAIGEKRESSR